MIFFMIMMAIGVFVNLLQLLILGTWITILTGSLFSFLSIVWIIYIYSLYKEIKNESMMTHLEV